MHCSQATQKQTEARDGGVKQCALLLPEQAWCINNHFLTLGFLPLVVGVLADIGFPLAFWGGQSALAVRAACHTATSCDRYLSPPCSCSFFLSRCSILCVCQCLCVCVCGVCPPTCSIHHGPGNLAHAALPSVGPGRGVAFDCLLCVMVGQMVRLLSGFVVS